MAFDTNEFVNELIGVSRIIVEKRDTLEEFRDTEDYLKKYRDKLSELDKACKDASLNSYKNIKVKLENYLKTFNMEDLPSNVENVEKVISFLRSHEDELHRISAVLKYSNSAWKKFMEKLKITEEKEEPRFIKEINSKMNSVNSSFVSASFDELGRVEVDAEKLKKEISEVINSFDFFNMILDKYVFIGEEAKSLQNEIIHFLENDFYEDSLGELSMRRKKIENLLSIIKEEGTKTKRVGFFVVKMKRKGKKDIHSYTIKASGKILDNQENYNLRDYDTEETGKKIYFDNYPTSGIFERVEIAKKLEVSKSHYQAISELDKYSYGMFMGMGTILLLLALASMTSLLSPIGTLIPMIGFYFLFKWLFKKKKTEIDRKLNIDHSFYFTPVDLAFVKEGELGLNVDSLKITLLINDTQTFLKEEKNGSNKN